MSFKEYLEESLGYGKGDAVLPLRGHISGNTVEKSAVSAVEFFGGNMSAVVIQNEKGKNFAVYGSGDGERAAKYYEKDDNKTQLKHDQSGRPIGGVFKIIGWFNIDKEGVSKTSSAVKASTKLAGAYTFK
jgi:hypothetical protein